MITMLPEMFDSYLKESILGWAIKNKKMNSFVFYLFTVSIILFWAPIVNAYTFDFENPVSYMVGSRPCVIVSGDLNNDGKIDLIVSNDRGHSISVLLGNGDGTFATATNYTVGDRPGTILQNDFSGDGIIDLVVVNYNSPYNISVFIGKGDGTFNNAVNYLTGNRPLYGIYDYFNNDTVADLAIMNYGGSSISIFIGNGDGTFQNAVNYPAGSYPLRMTKGDFNNDGNIDLAVADYYEKVTLLTGHGDGIFSTGESYDIGSYPLSLINTDLNNDDISDLITVNYYSNNISVLLGRGDGTFDSTVAYDTGANPSDSISGDFDDDGYIDLALINQSDNNVSVYLNNGDGAFQTAVNYAVGSYPYGVNTGDFDNDGDLDLVISNYDDSNFSILLGEGDGAFVSSGENYSVAASPYYFNQNDFNNDNVIDLVATHYYQDSISVIVGLDTPPRITNFDIPTISNSLTVDVTAFTALDNLEVTGYVLNETDTEPLIDDPNWTTETPTSYLFSSEGQKTVYAWVKDEVGNISKSLSDNVTIDITPPVITLIGESSIEIIKGDTYTDQGATALDNTDGDITNNIVVVNNVDTNVAGEYIITYNIADSFSNPAVEVTRTITVKEKRHTISIGFSPKLINPSKVGEITTKPTIPEIIESPKSENLITPKTNEQTKKQNSAFTEKNKDQKEPPKIESPQKELPAVVSDKSLITNEKTTEQKSNNLNNGSSGNLVLGTLFKNIARSLFDQINSRFSSLFSNTFGKIAFSATIVIGAILGIVTNIIGTLFNGPLSLREIYYIPGRVWSLILYALGLKKRNRPWGSVYDSVTKQPLDPVYVILENLEGKEIATCITDLDGRFGFLVPAGQYRLKVNKTNYKFPSQKLQGKINDEIYDDLYFGDIIEVNEGEVIDKNVPMDPLRFDWNEFAKQDQKLLRFFSKKEIWIHRISNILFVLGFIFTIITVYTVTSGWNILILIIYLLLFLFEKIIVKPRSYGNIKYKETNTPLAFAIIKIFTKDKSSLIAKKVSTKMGKYYCLISKGEYSLQIEKKNPDESYTKVYTEDEVKVLKGYINKNFRV